MPVDKTMIDAILGTFRNMLKDCRDKEMTGEDLQQMETALERMEQLGQEMNDVGAFSGQMMQEGLFMKFSDHYGRLLASAAQTTTANGVYDETTDKALLQQTILAYKDAIRRLKENKQETQKRLGSNSADANVLFKDKAIIDAIENLVRTAESGLSYPQFLVEMMKQGLDKAMEGTITSREAQLYILDGAKATAASPFYISKEEEKIILFDQLCNQSKAGMVDPLQYSLGCEKIEWRLQPEIIRWNKIKDSREKAAFMLDEWATSFCSFAASIEPWAHAADPHAAVLESKDCVPGKIRVWEKINKEYFELSIADLFRHESMKWDVQYDWMYWSQEYIEFLLNEIENICQPDQVLSAELIKKAESFHQQMKKVNPRVCEPAHRYAKYFDSYFGKGEYERRFGLPEQVETNAAAWKPL